MAQLKDFATLISGVKASGEVVLIRVDDDGKVDTQLSGLQIFPFKLFEWTNSTWIATQGLTADGVQLSDAKTLTAGGAEAQVFGAIFEPPKSGVLAGVQLGLTAQMQSDGDTQAKVWQWKARNKDGTWVDLHTEVSENLTTSYVEKYRSGVFYAVTNFNAVPFEIGLFGTPSAAETFVCQVKSSSMGIVIYKQV